MADMSWRDAIIKVLGASPDAMHYSVIAKAISDEGLRKEVGATPAASVNATISVSLKDDGEQSPFIRVEPGRYWLRELALKRPPQPAVAATADSAGLINALGMYWARSSVFWQPAVPKILGQQQSGSTTVDFAGQKGVYLLHDGREVIYVGRTTDRPLGVRLKEHITDRLSGRWDRFSWFGVYAVADTGKLDTAAIGAFDLSTLIATMEALLIEGLEPRQNRKRGDDFGALEFLQIEDPAIDADRKRRLLEDLMKK